MARLLARALPRREKSKLRRHVLWLLLQDLPEDLHRSLATPSLDQRAAFCIPELFRDLPEDLQRSHAKTEILGEEGNPLGQRPL